MIRKNSLIKIKETEQVGIVQDIKDAALYIDDWFGLKLYTILFLFSILTILLPFLVIPPIDTITKTLRAITIIIVLTGNIFYLYMIKEDIRISKKTYLIKTMPEHQQRILYKNQIKKITKQEYTARAI